MLFRLFSHYSFIWVLQTYENSLVVLSCELRIANRTYSISEHTAPNLVTTSTSGYIFYFRVTLSVTNTTNSVRFQKRWYRVTPLHYLSTTSDGETRCVALVVPQFISIVTAVQHLLELLSYLAISRNNNDFEQH